MSRNMIDANTDIFASLDTYCANRGDPVRNAGSPRWISGSSSDSDFLAHATFDDSFNVSPLRCLARISRGNTSYFCSGGFASSNEPKGLTEEDLTPGLFAVFLCETRLCPCATPLEVRNNIEVSDKRADHGYDGHDFSQIKNLFGDIRVFVGGDILAEETWRVFYEMCIFECQQNDTWVDNDLTASLLSLSALSPLNIPYQTLCRSIFDTDPAALFLGLYRCLEALYAYSNSMKVKKAFGLDESWTTVAATLETELGWRPRGESSLLSLFAHVDQDDLAKLFSDLGEEVPTSTDTPLTNSATQRIYRLRNGLVHFRPTHHSIEYKAVDWNRLCETITRLIATIYGEVHKATTTA